MHAQFEVNGSPVEVYFARDAFDLLPLATDEKTHDTQIRMLVEQIVIALAHATRNQGFFSKSLYISGVLLTGSDGIQIIYTDDKSSRPTTLDMERKEKLPEKASYNRVISYSKYDDFLVQKVRENTNEIAKLKLKQFDQAKENFVKASIPPPEKPPSLAILKERQKPHVLSESQKVFSNSQELRQEIITVADNKVQKIKQAQTALATQRKSYEGTIRTAEIDESILLELPEDAGNLVQAYSEQAIIALDQEVGRQQLNLQKTIESIQANVAAFDTALDQEQAQYAKKLEKNMDVKLAILQAMHQAAYESFDLIRKAPPEQREAARLKFNSIYTGFAEISELGKLSYGGENFLQEPLSKLSAVNAALLKASPEALEQFTNAFSFGKPNTTHLTILKKHLAQVGDLVKVEDTLIKLSRDAFDEEAKSLEDLSVQQMKIRSVALGAKKEIASIDVDRHSQRIPQEVEKVAKDILQSQERHIDYLFLLNYNQNLITTTEENLADVMAQNSEIQHLALKIETNFSADSEIAKEIIPLAKEYQLITDAMTKLVKMMRDRESTVLSSLQSPITPTPFNMVDLINAMAELKHHWDASFTKNNISIQSLNANALEIEERVKSFRANMRFYENLNRLDGLIEKLDADLEKNIDKLNDINDGFYALQRLKAQGYVVNDADLLEARSHVTDTEQLVNATQKKYQHIKHIRDEYASQVKRGDIPENEREAHLNKLREKVIAITQLGREISDTDKSITSNLHSQVKLFDRIENENQLIIKNAEQILKLIENVDFWKTQVNLLGGSKVGDKGLRVPTGIAKMINTMKIYTKQNPNWHTNPERVINLLNMFQQIAAARLPKAHSSKLNLFSKKEPEDKESFKFYKMLKDLDLMKLSESEYSEKTLREFTASYEQQSRQTPLVRR